MNTTFNTSDYTITFPVMGHGPLLLLEWLSIRAARDSFGIIGNTQDYEYTLARSDNGENFILRFINLNEPLSRECYEYILNNS